MDSRAVSIWEWYLNLRLISVNNTQERWLLTCAEEKHTDMIDSLSRGQLEGSLSFVDLL